MRIVIDIQGAQSGSRYRGIGRYTLSFTKALVRNREQHEVILALNGLFPDSIESIREEFAVILPHDFIRVWHSPSMPTYGDTNIDWNRRSAELIREAFLISQNPDIIIVSSLFEGINNDSVTSIGRLELTCPTAVILYDLIPYIDPDNYLADQRSKVWYAEKLNHLSKADILLAISESSKTEAVQHLGFLPENIFNISAAIESDFIQTASPDSLDSSTLPLLGINRPFLLYSGASDPRKNHLALISAYRSLPAALRENYQLVLAGGMPIEHQYSFQNHARLLGLSRDSVIFTGYLHDTVMIKLYQDCYCFVFPSLHEGFGLPALEAMACGAPTIGSNVSSIPEVIGLPEALFDPTNVASIAEKIEQVLSDSDFRNRLRIHGKQRASQFTWDSVALRALRALETTIFARKTNAPKLTAANLQHRLISKICTLPATKVDQKSVMQTAQAIAAAFPPQRLRQILVDISILAVSDAKSGIQRVTRNVLTELLKAPPEGYVVRPVCATPGSGYRYAGNFAQLISDCLGAEPDDEDFIDVSRGDIFLGLDYCDLIVPAQIDYFSRLINDGIRVYFVVYDLLPTQSPHWFATGAGENQRRWLEVIRKSSGAFCISQSVAGELKSWLSTQTTCPRKNFGIDWFHLGADIVQESPSLSLPPNAEVTLETAIARPCFLAVGTIEPRKGYAQTIDAFSILWDTGVDVSLVIVGKQGWMVDKLVRKITSHNEFGHRLVWLTDVTDAYLNQLFKTASCLIAPSEGEGFGLPLIEAARHRLPILARDIPVFREVAGNGAHYFAGITPNCLAMEIREWINLKNFGRQPKSDSLAWLTWEASTQALVKKLLSNTTFP